MKKLNCILLIDDNADDNFFHTIVINETEAAKHIITATNGERALEYFEKTIEDPVQNPVPDLIFLDINMPGMNGFEFLEKARAKKLIDMHKPVVVVMLTSSLNPGDEIMAKNEFANEIKLFKNKPLTEDVLKEIIEKYF